jgi:polyhydroxyalkanoate synthase
LRDAALKSAAQAWTSAFEVADALRQAQAAALSSFGLGPVERPFRIVARGPFWHLREYLECRHGPAVLVVATPIKKPYLWDLAPRASALRACMRFGMRVFLLEWLPAETSMSVLGLGHYAGEAVAHAVAHVRSASGAPKLFLMGHSLGGTFAAISSALDPKPLHGLVLLAAPLCFAPGTSGFRDHLAALAPYLIPQIARVPGSLLSQISAVASLKTFIWSRLADAALSLGDRQAMDMHARVERWTLDEAPLPGRLVRDILQLLYCEDRLCRGKLRIGARTVGPALMRTPTLAVVNTADEIAPLSAVKPFLDQAATDDAEVIAHGPEPGVGLQHVCTLVGRRAHESLWPRIDAWVRAHHAR